VLDSALYLCWLQNYQLREDTSWPSESHFH
jgi:hypothetical protein